MIARVRFHGPEFVRYSIKRQSISWFNSTGLRDWLDKDNTIYRERYSHASDINVFK